MSCLRTEPAFAVTFSIRQAWPVHLLVSKLAAAILIYYVSLSCHSVLKAMLQKMHPTNKQKNTKRIYTNFTNICCTVVSMFGISTFHDCFRREGMKPRRWQVDCPHFCSLRILKSCCTIFIAVFRKLFERN
jgi:hypothetical protein